MRESRQSDGWMRFEYRVIFFKSDFMGERVLRVWKNPENAEFSVYMLHNFVSEWRDVSYKPITPFGRDRLQQNLNSLVRITNLYIHNIFMRNKKLIRDVEMKTNSSGRMRDFLKLTQEMDEM